MKRSTYTLRRLLALVLVLVMVGSLFAGCNKKDPDPTDPDPSNEPTATVSQTDPTDEPTDPTVEPTDEPTEPVVTVPPVTMGTVSSDNLNVRNEPYTTGTDILKRLPINTRVEILETKIVDGIKWGRIAEGWINLNYVIMDGEGTGNVVENQGNIGEGTANTDVNKTYNGVITTTELHIREDADADSKSVGTYKKGDKVVIIGQRDGWGKTDKGWINMKYVDIGGSSSGSNSGSSSSGSSSGTNTGSVSNGNKIALGTGTVINTTSLKVRSGPSTAYAETGFIRLGETYPYYQRSNGWIRLQKGWVNANYMDLEYAIEPGTVGTINTGELNVREKADSDSKSLATVKKGDEVTILEVDGIWGKIEYETGKFGWINLDYVKFTTVSSTYTVGEYSVTADYLHYRKEADADSTALGTYKKNDKVTVSEVDGNWGKTDKGWINLKYTEMIAVYTTGTGTVTASTLNIRSKASTSGTDLGSLKKNTKVTILEVDGSWGKIEYATGKYGWISLKYVEMDPAAKYTVTVDSSITGGKVTVSSKSYAKGTTVSLTVTPDSGKELTSLTYTVGSGSPVTITNNKFVMPAGNVTIKATFGTAVAKYTVTLNANPTAGGTVTANATTNVTKDTEIVLTVTPKTGYVLDGITALNTTNNTEVTVNNGKFTMPAGNVNVVVKFKPTTETTYTVKSTSDRVSVSTSSALAGESITLTVNPQEGKVLSELIVKNTSDNSVVYTATSGNSHSFTMPAANVTVAATFADATYKVNIAQATGGTVSTDKTSYKKGETVTLTVNLADGYELETLKANNTDVKAASSFVMPGSDASVTVTYKKTQYTVTVNTAEHGKVTADKTSAGIDELITLTATPDSGYKLTDVVVKKGDATVTKESATTFKMPAGNVTVTPTFTAVATYTVTVASGIENGTVTVDKTSAPAGATVKITVTPASGYELDKLYVNDAATPAGDITMPAANVTIKATFKPVMSRTMTVTVVNAAGNPIPNAKVTINPVADGVGAAIASATANSSGVATFNTSALKDIAIGTKLVAEPGAGYEWETGNPLRTGSASEGMTYTTDSNSNGYLTVNAESFVGSFTIKIKATS
ncbi:MAG: SH3 domain-containing protein [Oscillospiraceae bacterium]|nr:SH3 domain-containing protein [Oscillospiraceae bacterium]